MSKHPGALKIIELVEDLRKSVAEFAAREDQLQKELSSGLAHSRRRIEESTKQQLDQLAAEMDQAAVDYEEATARIDARFEHWKSAITRAYKLCAPRRLKAVEEQEQQKKSDIQQEFAGSNRRKDEELRRADEELARFNEQLASECAVLEQLNTGAANALGGFGSLKKLLFEPPVQSPPEPGKDEQAMLGQLRNLLASTEAAVKRLRSAPLAMLFRLLPVWLLLTLVALSSAAAPPLLNRFGVTGFTFPHAGIAGGAGIILILVLHFIGARVTRAKAADVARGLEQARLLHDAAAAKAVEHREREHRRVRDDAATRTREIQARWKQTEQDAKQRRRDCEKHTDKQVLNLNQRNEVFHDTRLKRAEADRDERVSRLEHRMAELREGSDSRQSEESKQRQAESESTWAELAGNWNGKIPSIYAALNASREDAAQMFPDWRVEVVKKWEPPPQFAEAARFGSLDINVAQLAGALPRDGRLALPGPAGFSVPLLLATPDAGSLLIETKQAGSDAAVGALNNIILRLFSVSPPGRVNFTIIDPVELGQNFAGLMHLADFEDRLINSRIWTQTAHIEQQLANLNEHIEKVTQMYLRNEYATIAEYNKQAGRIAEKYHFLVIADFPVNFSETAVKRLMSIAASGPRCGVYSLIHWDQRRTAPAEFVPDDLRKNSICLVRGPGEFVFANHNPDGLHVQLDPPPDADLATMFLHKVGQASIDSNRVEMPFDEVIPKPEEVWSLETTNELRVPIGRTGATKLQFLSLGKGTRQHALVAGKTGSGKSTLFHVLITNLALWCGPDQVEFYLVDFKKGVEFKCYGTNRLPHARVVAIESDREFGLSVLHRLDEELKRRGDLFRKLGVQDLAGYKKADGSMPMPRTLLLIDEFQELFVDDDKIASEAALLLDRIVRQGRAFGIHVVLGSQTLGGAYTLARTTLGQMVVRIALQCNEADAYLIMDDSNPAPRMLSRPGEAIYNDTAGSIEGNSPFQIVWLSDEERDGKLGQVSSVARERGDEHAGPIVFEGNAPADVRENSVLAKLLGAETIQPSTTTRAWLGAPNSIKGPTEAVFQRQSGNNLLLVGQREESALSILATSLISLAAQHHRGGARFAVIDCTPPESSQRVFLESVVQAIPHEITLAGNAELDEVLKQFAGALEQRSEPGRESQGAAHYLFINGLQRFKKLRQEEEFGFSLDDTATEATPGALLTKLISEGPALGVHVICTCDGVNNVTRFLGRKSLAEFDLRVLFQMSANDSAMLIDSPKAGNLGLHRALFHNEQQGYLETFRPYALPGRDWIESAAARLNRLVGNTP